MWQSGGEWSRKLRRTRVGKESETRMKSEEKRKKNSEGELDEGGRRRKEERRPRSNEGRKVV